VQRVVLDLASRLDPAAFRSEVWALRGGALVEELRARGAFGGVVGAKDLVRVHRVVALARRMRGAALVHCHAHEANVTGRVAARLAGVPAVAHLHNPFSAQRPGAGARWLERRLHGGTAAVIGVSRAILDDWVAATGLPRDRLVELPNGVDPARFASPPTRAEVAARFDLPEREPWVAMVARLAAQKDHATFVCAAARAGGSARFLLIGDGAPAQGEALLSLARAEGVGARLRWLGERADVDALLPHLAASVLATRYEGFGLVAIEAMAAGVPFVGTRVPALEEVVGGDAGLLVPPGDADALAAALARVLGDAALRERLVAAGRARAARYSADAAARALAALYRRILGTEDRP
jgi:glycosyltransferase involved in cell wall biosynthesis